METRVTFRHLEPNEEFKAHAEKELAKLSRYLHRPLEAQAIFSREKNRYLIELNLLADKNQFLAREQDEDFYLAFDRALNKVESQVKKYRDRCKPVKRPKAKAERETELEPSPEIIRSREFFIAKPLTVEEAVDSLGNMRSQFVVFRNAANEKICVVYRLGNGNFGLIEPE